MTKYVLNSGGVWNDQGKAKEFFSEIVKDLGEDPKILLCFFAKPREDWEKKFLESKEKISNILEGIANPTFTMALPDTFAKQVKDCDALYFHGGDDHLILYWLKQFNLPKLFEGKVIATNSASSNALSTSFWTCDWRECMIGLGILPIKFLPHFKSNYGETDPRGSVDWDKGMEELKVYGDKNLPIYALKEGEYKTFTVA